MSCFHWGSAWSVIQDMLAPKVVSPLNKTENTQGVDVEAQRDSIGIHEDFSCLDMVPGGLMKKEVGKESLRL